SVSSSGFGSAPVTVQALHAIFSSEWEYEMAEWSECVLFRGDHRYDDRWPDVSPAAYERRAAHERDLVARLRALDPSALGPEDRLSFDLFRREHEFTVEGDFYRLFHLALNQRDGIQTVDDIADVLSFAMLRDYEVWVARLHALPTY